MGCGASSEQPTFSSVKIRQSSFSGSSASVKPKIVVTYKKPKFRNRNFPDGEVNKNGLKIRLRRRLKLCIAGDNADALQETMSMFEKLGMRADPDYRKGLHKLEYLKLKKDLRDALRRRNASVLRRAIKNTRRSEHAGKLAKQIQVCEKLRKHLKEIPKYTHDILDIEQTTVSEIRSYDHPPDCIFQVMSSVYRLLGYDEDDLQTWKDVQGLMGRSGKESLLKLVEDYDVMSTDDETTEHVRKVLEKHPIEKVRLSSNGAAAFHAWASGVIEEIKMENSSRR